MNLNKIMLIGNLTRDPETRTLPSGTQVTKFRIAVSRRFSKRDGDKGEETLFIDVETWSRTAEIASQYLRRGSQVFVEGRLKQDSYQTQSGEKREKMVVVAENIQLGARAGDGGGQTDGPPQRSRSFGPPADRASEPDYPVDSYANDDRADSGPSDSGTDDDLPF